MSFETPAYQRIAADLRRQILDGDLPPGARVPSRVEICERYDVSETVALRAVRLLIAEGLAEGRSGSGTYVRARTALHQLVRYPRSAGNSPFLTSAAKLGRAATWTWRSRTDTAPLDIAQRLGIEPGDRVMRTQYVFREDGEPVMLATSFEPLAITAGQPILLPEEGPLAGRGVVERMAAIGVTVARVREVVGARTARGDEASRLGEAAGAMLVTVERTHLDVDGRAVETADVLAPAGRVAVAYEWPVP